jgi:hypothetical protein
LQGAVSLKWIRPLQRVAALLRIAGLAWTVLLLILLRLALSLRVSSASEPDEDSSRKTLRPKCNFIHESHLAPSGFPGIPPVVLCSLE